MFCGDPGNVSHAYYNFVKVTIYINLFMRYYTYYEIQAGSINYFWRWYNETHFLNNQSSVLTL